MKLISGDVNMARVFVETARAAFGTGMTEEGQFTRLRAIKFYCCAVRTDLELEASERKQCSSDIEYLRMQIEWLLMELRVEDATVLLREEVFMKKLLQLLGEKG
jgi:hypothetical protein